MPDSGSIIERNSKGWSFRFDLSHLPEYALLQLHGYPLPARAQALLEVWRSLHTQTTTPQGQTLPLIVDMRGEDRISMDTLKEGRFVTERPDEALGFVAFVVESEGRKMELFLSMTHRFSAQPPPIVGTLEEAIALVRAYHEEHISYSSFEARDQHLGYSPHGPHSFLSR